MSKENFLYDSIDRSEINLSKIISFNTKNENEIWMDFINGDDSALSYIYRNYANSLYNYGRQFTGDELVQDCIQDLFYDLIKSRKKLANSITIKAYLFSSLRRKIVRKLKQNRLEVEEDRLDKLAKFKVDIATDGSSPLDDFTVNRLEILKKACNALSARQREAIMLFYFENLSYKEIADILDMSKVASARILIYRALDSLKKNLGNVKEELLMGYLGWLIIQ